MNTQLYWLTSRLPCRIISDDGTPYLERYYLGTVFGVRFYLHRFVGSDPARGLHDHPWAWARSIVLSGWYFEERRDGKRHKVKWYNKLTGDTFHRVILPFYNYMPTPSDKLPSDWPLVAGNPIWKLRPDDYAWDKVQPCWTLFFHKVGHVKPWGFLKFVAADPWITPNGERVKVGEWRGHNFPLGGTATSSDWWLTVPKGRDEPRRAGKGRAL